MDGGSEPVWLELKLDPHLANTDDDIARNIEYALSRPYIPLPQLIAKSSGAVSVVGSGPSLKKNWKRLRAFKGDIIACNAACQFLLEKGIVPKYMFCFDADPLMLEFITPHPDITYLMGSRCPPKAFDLLEGCKVVLWHAGGDRDIEWLLNKHQKMDEPMVSGGSAAVTRAMLLAQALGHTEIHLWGCDSSFDQNDTHIRQSTTKENCIVILCNKRVFHCAPWMAQQAEDFKILAPAQRDIHGIRLVVHGDGLIPHLAAAMNFDVDVDSWWTQFSRQWKSKARTLWSQL